MCFFDHVTAPADETVAPVVSAKPIVEPDAPVAMATIGLGLVLGVVAVGFVIILVLVVTYYRQQIQKLK